jgi:hypothetical protein
MFLLAKNTGTSSDMIECFYGRIKLERTARELRPEWRVGAGAAILEASIGSHRCWSAADEAYMPPHPIPSPPTRGTSGGRVAILGTGA